MLSVKKQGVYQGLGRPGNKALNPQATESDRVGGKGRAAIC